MDRQVIISGYATAIKGRSATVFPVVPEKVSFAAWASEQSHPIDSREQLLEQKFAHIQQRFR